MHIKFRYKSYKECKAATVVSIIGGLFNAVGKIIPLTCIVAFVRLYIRKDKIGMSNLSSKAIYFAIIGVAMLIIGYIFNIIAAKIALKERAKKLQLTLEEVEEMVDKKPQLKQWFLDNHQSYRQLHKSDMGYRNLDNNEAEEMDKKVEAEKKRIRILGAYLLGFILIAGFIALFPNGINKNESSSNNNKNSEASTLSSTNKKSDYEYEKKYQCYVEFNNDIVDCYNNSIELYFKSKGNSETVNHKYNQNTVDMGPILKQKYENLEKAKASAKSDPKMDIDEEVIKLTEATEKLYDLIGEIYCAYGGDEQYGKKTDKSKEELHKEFYACVKEYYGIYNNFRNKFESMSIEHMGKELEQYKNKGDMDSYETLNILIKSEEIYRYFIDNSITNENLFNMNLDEYGKLLDDYNKAYAEFKKQDIKGNSCHTETFSEFAQAYHSFANNIINMVNNKTFDAGKLDAAPGLVAPDDRKDIQERLYFYIDRMVSDYNSIQSFKK